MSALLNYISILDLTPGLNGLRKDNCKTRRETFKFSDFVWLYKDLTVTSTTRIFSTDINQHVTYSYHHLNPIWYKAEHEQPGSNQWLYLVRNVTKCTYSFVRQMRGFKPIASYRQCDLSAIEVGLYSILAIGDCVFNRSLRYQIVLLQWANKVHTWGRFDC